MKYVIKRTNGKTVSYDDYEILDDEYKPYSCFGKDVSRANPQEVINLVFDNREKAELYKQGQIEQGIECANAFGDVFKDKIEVVEVA